MAQVERGICADLAKFTIKREPPVDAKKFGGKPNKLESYLSPNPGHGD